MRTNRFKAIWKYNQCCLRKGQVFAECEAATLTEFSHKLCTTYAYGLGDGFSFMQFENEEQIKDFFGDDLPEWYDAITAYPVLVFSSNFGTEILCNPSATAIVKQICDEAYGDYDLEIKGI